MGGGPQTETALRKQALLLQLAPVLVRDPQDTIVYWTRGTELLYGFSAEEALGRTSQELLQTTFVEPRARIMARVRAGRDWQGEVSQLRRDGATLFVLSHWVPQMDAQGRLEAIVEVNTDITARKQAELAQARLAAIVQSSENAIVSKTLDGVISSWNPSAERMFGYTAAEAIGQPITLIIPPELRQEEETILGRLRRGEHIGQFETVRLAKDGRRLQVALAISPVRDTSGLIVGASKIIRDLTPQHQAQEANRRLSALLSASHKAIGALQTPLRSLHHSAQLALEQSPQANHPEMSQLLQKVLGAAELINRRIQELLALR